MDVFRMTRVAYLGWMEHKIMTEGQMLDHSKWPCRKRSWNSGGFKYSGGKSGDKYYRQSDEEFFVIDEMMNNDDSMKSKKLFLLYIKMDDPNGINKDSVSVAWGPLAKVFLSSFQN